MGFLGVPTADLNYLTQAPGIFLSFLKKYTACAILGKPKQRGSQGEEFFSWAVVIKRLKLPFGPVTRLLSEALWTVFFFFCLCCS
jgi:hypothetical protein